MIKLERISPPKELTSEEVEKLTKEFKEEGKSVCRKPYIKKQTQ